MPPLALALVILAPPPPRTPPADPGRSCLTVVTPTGVGSGTVIARQGADCLVLTNRHVVAGAAAVSVIAAGPGGRKVRYPARVLAVNPGADRDGSVDAALVVARADLPAAGLAAQDPAVGDAVSHHGHATGPQAGAVARKVTYAYPGDPTGVCSELLSVPGDSGAGVFNAAGELCGLHHSAEVRTDGREIAVCAPVGEIRPFLAAHAADWGDWGARTAPANTPQVGKPAPRAYAPAPTYVVPQSPPARPHVPGFTGSGAGYTPAGQFYPPPYPTYYPPAYPPGYAPGGR